MFRSTCVTSISETATPIPQPSRHHPLSFTRASGLVAACGTLNKMKIKNQKKKKKERVYSYSLGMS